MTSVLTCQNRGPWIPQSFGLITAPSYTLQLTGGGESRGPCQKCSSTNSSRMWKSHKLVNMNSFSQKKYANTSIIKNFPRQDCWNSQLSSCIFFHFSSHWNIHHMFGTISCRKVLHKINSEGYFTVGMSVVLKYTAWTKVIISCEFSSLPWNLHALKFHYPIK